MRESGPPTVMTALCPAASGITSDATPAAKVRLFISSLLPQAGRFIRPWESRFTGESTNRQVTLGGGVLQLVALERVTELVVAQTQCGGRGALVEAIAPEAVLEELPLVGCYRSSEIIGRVNWLRCRRDGLHVR